MDKLLQVDISITAGIFFLSRDVQVSFLALGSIVFSQCNFYACQYLTMEAKQNRNIKSRGADMISWKLKIFDVWNNSKRLIQTINNAA